MSESNGIVVRHTADKMKAFVSLSGAFGPVTAGEVLTELLHKGVVHGLNTSIIHKLVGASLFNKFVEVASGTVATPGVDGRVEILVSAFKPAEALLAMATGRPSKPRQLCDFVVVKAGALIARHVPPVLGVDGMDVFGTPIAAAPVKDMPLPAGIGTIVMDGDSNTLIAECDGVFKMYGDGTIDVIPYKVLAGDVCGSTGNVVFDGCLRVEGAVRSGFTVDVTGSLLVMGEVGDATVKCGGDLSMRGGARGSGAAQIECGGSVQAAYLDGVALKAGGNVTVAGDIVESEVAADKGVVRARDIRGGSILATGGIFASRIGSEGRIATVLDVSMMHNYGLECDAAKENMSSQAIRVDECISELYGYVRDRIGDDGFIPPAAMADYEQHRTNLTGSIEARRKSERDIRRLKALLDELAGCCISANEIYPNVSLRLGFSEQHVRDVMKNVCLKPAGF
ncbi:MAG: FapA family protein [Chitinispirillia bacterium]|nr:FapA family protein [Chitinispirillia bacterium]MCL2268350.1 FapA family protein [Chitinispirillia bacterium]